MKNLSIHNLLILIILVLFSILMSLYSYHRPAHNMDMLFYMGVILSIDEYPPQRIHETVYEKIKEFPSFTYLTTKNARRKHIYRDYTTFNQQLAFYRVKPFYTYITYISYKLTNNLAQSTYLPSIVASFFICIITVFWLRTYFTGLPLLIIFLFTLGPSGLYRIGALSTPDALSALLIILGIYFFKEKKRIFASQVILLCSIGVRPDNIIIYTLAMIFYSLIFKKMTRRFLVFSVSAGLIFYFAINSYFESYGFSTLFHHSFFGYIDRPAEFSSVITPSLYLKALFRNLLNLPNISIIYLLFTQFIMVWFILDRDKLFDENNLLNGLLYLSVLAHFIAFPKHYNRFFTGQFICITIILCIIARNFKNHNDRVRYLG